MTKVAIIMGSSSDEAQVSSAFRVLDYFGISYESKVLSAHRSPEQLVQYVKESEEKGINIFIAAAGMAAHLAGAVASRTNLPVIGVPLSGGELKGIDALLSTVQMPAGIPVATMAIGKTGAENAAIYAVRILALTNENLRQQLMEFAKNGYRLPG
jgi:5-(carboxyamino)imidazole ribonucleotide mutase